MKDKTRIIGSAARRKRRQILGDILVPSTKEFLSKFNLEGQANVLDLGCGTGETTLLLKSRMSREGRLIGLDSREPRLKTAREKAHSAGFAGIEFKCENLLEWKEAACYDLVYSRHFFYHLKHPANMLHHICHSLKPGGRLLVEELDFSKFQCFPNSYAFDRFVELYTEVIRIQGANPNIGSRLQRLMEHTGFAHCRSKLVLPRFLFHENKQLASLTLESISTILELEKLAAPDEIQVLIAELKAFESRPGTMITLPGIYQVVGYKTNS